MLLGEDLEGDLWKEKNSSDNEESSPDCLSESSKWVCNSMKVLLDYFQAEAQESLQSGQERGEHGCQQLNMSMSKGMGG